jgi:hypothetical protein
VQRQDVEVLRMLADMKGGGPAEAMHRLESKLPSRKGRRFYGTFRLPPESEEYFACVEKVASDDPASMDLDVGTLPGGSYIRRKVHDWENVIAAGKLGAIFEEMVSSYHVDRTRPSIEYYRSMSELHLLVPVLDRDPTPRP